MHPVKETKLNSAELQYDSGLRTKTQNLPSFLTPNNFFVQSLIIVIVTIKEIKTTFLDLKGNFHSREITA